MNNINTSKDDVFHLTHHPPHSPNKTRSWTLFIPNATVVSRDADQYPAKELSEATRNISFDSQAKISSSLYRCLSDSAVHQVITGGHYSPPYSNFVRYLPCLSTPSGDLTQSSFASLPISRSEESSENNFRLPISASQLSLPEPPDGGWGWVIVFASFLVHLITEGVIVSFGIFIEDLAEEFQESMSATSWVGSFSYGIPALVTPISSLILDHFGCRVTCIFGALISCVGCLVGCFANSLVALVFTFGILCGFGFSLCTTAALVVVSVYFDDLRATATGLSIAGTGVGALIFAPAVEFLITVYTWRGTFMIMAGAVLHMAICGSLMRPVETRTQRRHRQRLAWLEHLARESGLPTLTKNAEYINKDVLGRIKLLRDKLLAPSKCSGRAHAVVRIPGEYLRGQAGAISVHTVENNRSVKVNDSFVKSPTKSRCNGRLCSDPVNVSTRSLVTQEAHITRSPLPVIPEYECLGGSAWHISNNGFEHIYANRNGFLTFPHHNQISTNISAYCSSSPDVYNFGNKKPLTRCNTLPAVLTPNQFVKRHGYLNCATVLPAFPTFNSNLPEKAHHQWIANKQPKTDVQPQILETEKSFRDVPANDTSVCSRVSSHDIPKSSLEVFYRASLLKAFGITRTSLCKALSLPDLSKVHRIRRGSGSCDSSNSSSPGSDCADTRCCIWLTREESDQEEINPDDGCIPSTHGWFEFKGLSLSNIKWRQICRRLCDLRLFRRSMFDLFLLSNVILYFWYNVTYFFMGVHAVDLGFSESQAALLFSVLGGANMVGEIVVGLLADREWVDAITLYFMMLLACGISTLLVPYMTSFPLLSLYAGIFGMGLASNDALCTILLVEFVGLQHLTNALGICFFCQGVANILGPPAIGYIIDSTQSKDLAYIISGVGLVLSGLVVIPIIIRRFRRKRARQLHRKQCAAKQPVNPANDKSTAKY